MTWFHCLEGNGGGSDITLKNYIKFNGNGIVLPWAINADHKLEVVFYESTYVNDGSIIGNSFNAQLSHLTTYSNIYYCSSGTSETNFGSWSSGEHTFIENNGNGKNEFDGIEVTNFNPTTDNNVFRTLGCRARTDSNVYYGYIKSYKIYSISSGVLLHHLKPATIFNSAIGVNQDCFIDVVGGGIYLNNSIQAVDTI